MGGVRILHSDWNDTEGLGSQDPVGQPCRALYWIYEGGNKERHAIFRVTSSSMGLLISMEQWALIFQITAKKLFQLNNTNPHTSTFGTEADFSYICQYAWYEWVYYRDAKIFFPYHKK